MSFFKTYTLITLVSLIILGFLVDRTEENTIYEIINVLIGINLLFVYPVYLFIKVLRMIWSWLTGGSKPLNRAQEVLNARSKAHALLDILDLEKDKNKIKKIKEKLKGLVQEYKTELKSMKKVKEVYEEIKERRKRFNSPEAMKKRMEMDNKRHLTFIHGNIASKVKCHHCDSVGTVRRKVTKNLEESREKGIIGAVIGRKTITDKGNITKFFCENCGTSWTT